ncbi:MAG: imm11 family protein, partial [Gemmataceae bacterium]
QRPYLRIKSYQWDWERFGEHHIFRPLENYSELFVSDAFVRRVREAKLEGIIFQKVWPLPPHVDVNQPHLHPECYDEWSYQTDLDPRPPTGNAVLLRLKLAGKKPTADETAKVEAIADRADALLVNPKKTAKYYGSLEVVETVSGEVRFFFSAPDADALAKKLKPWVKGLDWPNEIKMVKRYGAYTDEEATEQAVKL